MSTKAGQYSVSKPSAAYKSLSQHLAEAAEVAAVCYAALAASEGGASDASLSEIVAKLSRAKVHPPGRSASCGGTCMLCMHGVGCSLHRRSSVAAAQGLRAMGRYLQSVSTQFACSMAEFDGSAGGQELRVGEGGVAAECKVCGGSAGGAAGAELRPCLHPLHQIPPRRGHSSRPPLQSWHADLQESRTPHSYLCMQIRLQTKC